jgi:MFS family permease
MLIVATTVSALGTLVRPTLTSLITQATPRAEQGVVLGLTQSLTSISLICAPPFVGYLIQHQVLTGYGIMASGVAAVGLAIATRSAYHPSQIDT